MERALMIYLAIATVVTAAIFPIPLRTANASDRAQRSPTDPPIPTDDVFAPLVGEDIEEDACIECAEMAGLWAEVATIVETALEGAAASASGPDSEDDPLSMLPLYAGKGEGLADLAAGLAGLPYSWGGISPVTGFDCSGLVYYVHQQQGVTLSRDAAAQFGNGQAVHSADLRPGDIVFFSDTYPRGISHDGIYLGDGSFVHATQPGSVVRIASMGDEYWGPRYVGARRVFD